MNTATTPKAQVPDIAAQITFAMRAMGIAAIPRNYELFYEAYLGSNPALTRDLAGFGSRATQEELDHLGQQYFGSHHTRTLESAHAKIIHELDGLLRLLKQEQSSLESYNKLLGETYTRINSKSTASADILRNAISILTEATGDTMAHGEKTVESVGLRSQDLDQVRRELDEYKRIANTDSLTRLANRRAFDERLAALYDSPATLGPMIATAFVATLWGLLSANFIFLPIGTRLKRLAELENERMTLLMEGVLAIHAGSQPRLLGERLRAMVPRAKDSEAA